MSGANINEVELRSWIPEEFSHSAGAPNLSWAGLDRVLNLAFLLFFFICKKVVVHGTSFFIFLEISGTTLLKAFLFIFFSLTLSFDCWMCGMRGMFIVFCSWISGSFFFPTKQRR